MFAITNLAMKGGRRRSAPSRYAGYHGIEEALGTEHKRLWECDGIMQDRPYHVVKGCIMSGLGYIYKQGISDLMGLDKLTAACAALLLDRAMHLHPRNEGACEAA